MKELLEKKFKRDYYLEKAPKPITKYIPGYTNYMRGLLGENNDVLLLRLLYFQGDVNNCRFIFQTAGNCYHSSHLTVNCQALI